jgi:DNA polymerase-4
MPAERWILHADMDAFYASVEQREDPSLVGKPVIVGAVSGRGVVTAASYEARKYGVRSAMPGFRARELCPHGVFLPGRMDLYAEVSREVRAVFDEFTPIVQPLALDEAFLDVSGSLGLFGGPMALGRELKQRVRARTRLPVSVGLGPNKLVAKVACTLGKPDGLRVVPEEDVRALLDPLPVRRLWGIGPVLAERLREVGIATIADLAHYDTALLVDLLGARAAEIQARARGEDPSPVDALGTAKSCGEENTFEVDILDRDIVAATLTAHAEAVAARLRQGMVQGRTVTLKFKLGKARGARRSRIDDALVEPVYPLFTRSRTLAVAVSDGKSIRDVALALWDDAAVRDPVRLLGVSVSNLEGRGSEQLELFSERSKQDALGTTLDEIRARFGKDSIGRAVTRPHKISPSGKVRPE